MEETTHLLSRARRRTTSVVSVLSEAERFSRRLCSTSSGVTSYVSFNNSDENANEPNFTISKLEAVTHIVKSYLGIGILTLPIAFTYAGLVGGTLGLIVVMFISMHCASILANAAQKLVTIRDFQNIDYANTAEIVFLEAGGRWANVSLHLKYIINSFLLFVQVGNNSVYILFVAQNLMPIVESSFSPGWDYRTYLLILFIPIILICSIRNLKYLSPLTIIANILELVGLAIIFYFIFASPITNVEDAPLFSSPLRFPIFFGTALFAFGGIAVVLPVQNQMTHPKDMLGPSGAIVISILFCGFSYLAMGFCGFIKFGIDTLPSISLNLPADNLLAQSCQAMFALAVYFSYALQFYVVMDIISSNVITTYIPDNWQLLVDYTIRFLLNLLIFCLAATIPWMDLLVALISCLTISTLSVMVPALIDTALYWRTDFGTKFKLRLFKNCFLLMIGFLSLVVGTYISLCDIIKKFNTGDE